MNCSFAEKVSMLIDGELSESESNQLRKHLVECAECQDLEKDFLFFRERIKETANFTAERMTTPIFPSEKRLPFWKRGISIPVPILSLLILAAVGLSIWLISSEANRIGEIATEKSAKNSPVKPEDTLSEFSIARFDKGGRAEIYVAPRGENR